MRRPTARRTCLPALVAVCCLSVVSCGNTPAPHASTHSAAPSSGTPAGPRGPGPGSRPDARIPGLGPATQAAIAAGTRQVLVVTGDPSTSPSHASASLYGREDTVGWRRVAGPWQARNAVRGWTRDHRAGDLRTPSGVFGIRDAGGLLPDPGTRLPYDRSEEFREPGTGFYGESLEGTFDYVLAIDYNRRPGTSPLDKSRPLGEEKGGGLWIHVDHEGPTKGCVALPRSRMRQLLRLLRPEHRPVVVMGPRAELLR
ncbi:MULTISPECIES: L,D-transpeptidase family protein [unclassified Streptomyces]|uniref:L,D-transpeptidase family protein n=1 Tax=unclassified Streptomyces TaxID=2593676 RepID=UPI000749EE8D|nr:MULTISPECIES: L,D-transpeptidase family protein [unclassified Streptomyces]KUL49476.1 hypothetical protein ADL30_32930 [Streptomyces sp. NRRL S-1521]THC51998.1 hypothetical protein E7X58_13545 [Streptomyces sp. A1499]